VTTLRNPEGEAAVSQIVNDTELMKLLDARDEFIANKDNYRSTDGEMKKNAAKTLAAMDERIARYAKLKGVPNPNERETVSVVGQKIDETLGQVTNEETKKTEAPKYPNLTAFEAKQYDSLAEKDMFDGLSTREQEIFDSLEAKKRTGVDLNQRVGIYEKATPEQMAELSAEESALIKKVNKRKKFSKATREIIKMRGVSQAVVAPQVESNTMERPGWRVNNLDKAQKKDNPIAWSLGSQTAIFENESDGKTVYEATRVVDGQAYSLGVYETFNEAADVAEGVVNPVRTQEAVKAIEPFWRSFNIRPKLIIMSIPEILKAKMPKDIRDTLVNSRGLFVQGEPGTVYINLDQHDSVAGVMRTLIHEMIAHFGLRATMSVKHWNRVLWAYAQYNRDKIKQLEAEGKSK
jgi:bacterioferritin (cytochrome b1)